jgi:hypothetical protein
MEIKQNEEPVVIQKFDSKLPALTERNKRQREYEKQRKQVNVIFTTVGNKLAAFSNGQEIGLENLKHKTIFVKDVLVDGDLLTEEVA